MDQSNSSPKLQEHDHSLRRAAINSFSGGESNEPDRSVLGVAECQTVEMIHVMPKTLQDLPQLPLGKIMKNVDLVEILDLALSSLHLKEGAISLRLSVSSMKWIIAAPGHCVIHIVPNDTNQGRIIFKLAQDSPSTFYPACVNNENIQIARSKNVFTVKCGSNFEENIQLLNDLTRTLLGIVEVKEFNFQGNTFVNFPFFYSRRFGNFSLTGGELTLEQMKTLMEEITVDIFKLENVFYPVSGCEVFHLKHRDMCLPLASWMCLQAFLNSKCEKLDITSPSRATIKPKGYVDTMKHLVTGMMKKLKIWSTTEKPEGELTINAFCKRIINELHGLGVNTKIEGWTVERNDGKRAVIKMWPAQLIFELID